MSDFVKQRHTQFAASDEVIFNLLKKATGKDIKEKQRVIEGEDSEVYDVTVQSGKRFILKINRFSDVGYKEEAWALDECRKKGVPVPDVVMLDSEDIDGQSRDIMVLKKLAGRDFRKVLDEKKLSKEQENNVFEQAGAILKKINSIKVEGYWRPRPGGKWDLDSWEDYIESSIQDRTKDKQTILDAGFSEADFDLMMEMHRVYKKKFPCKQPVLCHGDYTPEHWFVNDDLEITGIIDFGDVQGGPEITDLAMFNGYEPESKLQPLLRGYYPDGLPPDFEEKLILHRLTVQVGHAVHFTQKGNAAEVKRVVPQLGKTLRRLKSIFPK